MDTLLVDRCQACIPHSIRKKKAVKIKQMISRRGSAKERRKYGSQQDIRAEGSTTAPLDLWNSSPVVKALTKASEDMINKTASPFKNRRAIVKMFEKAIRSYTAQFGFNTIMLLSRFVDDENEHPTKMHVQAIKMWREQDPLNFATCRMMMHLTANCVAPRDLIVYRGLKDARGLTIKNWSDAHHQLSVLAKVHKLETELREALVDPRDMLEVMATGTVFEGVELKDSTLEGHMRARELARSLHGKQVNLSVESRDVNELVFGQGNAVETETFMSTSLSIEHARRFMDKESACCLLRITIPAGTPCFFVSPYSAFADEQSELEVVLPPCSRLIVQGRSNGVTRIHYDGVSDVARKRMTLDAPRRYVLNQMIDAIKAGEQSRVALRRYSGIFKTCKQVDGHVDVWTNNPMYTGNLTTFSNDVLQEGWDSSSDEARYKYREKRRRNKRRSAIARVM